MCKVLKVHRSGYYAWLRDPQCQRKKNDAYLLGYVKQFWLESGGVYGYRKITMDMKALGETCGRNRILRLMKGAPATKPVSFRWLLRIILTENSQFPSLTSLG